MAQQTFDCGDCAAQCGRRAQRTDLAASSVNLGDRDQAPVKDAVKKTAKEPGDRENASILDSQAASPARVRPARYSPTKD
jgi:hypothetical protein